MSTSDSDYSIDWLASDEDDYDSLISPQHRDPQPPPSSTTSLTEDSPSRSGTTHTNVDRTFKDGHSDRPKRKSGDNSESPCAATETPAQGYTCVGHHGASWAHWTTEGAVSGKRRQTCKRAYRPDFSRHCEEPELKDTQKMLFSQKCVVLQSYIEPLASILRGLRSGRYSGRLSSFQESVAIDRIQRIMGVLQNPNQGERFLSTLLQIEKMLESWFPHVKPRHCIIQADHSTPAKRQKRHRPMDILALSSLDADHSSRTSSHGPSSSLDADHSSRTSSHGPSSSLDADHSSRTSGHGPSSATSLTWLHTSTICSPKTAGQGQPAASSPPPSRCDLDATQDNAVSSSTDTHSGRFHLRQPVGAKPRGRQGPPPFKIRSPCLERLLRSKDSIVSHRAAEDGGSSEPSWLT